MIWDTLRQKPRLYMKIIKLQLNFVRITDSQVVPNISEPDKLSFTSIFKNMDR